MEMTSVKLLVLLHHQMESSLPLNSLGAFGKHSDDSYFLEAAPSLGFSDLTLAQGFSFYAERFFWDLHLSLFCEFFLLPSSSKCCSAPGLFLVIPSQTLLTLCGGFKTCLRFPWLSSFWRWESMSPSPESGLNWWLICNAAVKIVTDGALGLHSQ